MSETVFNSEKESLYRKIVLVVSILIPAVVAFLILMPQTGKLGDFDVSAFPGINATLNSLTSVCLIGALVAIKNKNITVHRTFMSTAFVLSACFLVLYVLYHFQGPSTRYGDLDHNGLVDEAEKLAAGSLRSVYFVILIAHIILAAVVLPFILLSFYFSLSGQIEKHKKIVKFSFPAWLFVAISGVVVYLMIRPYYPF
jgi:putative membrane protein